MMLLENIIVIMNSNFKNLTIYYNMKRAQNVYNVALFVKHVKI